MNEIEVIEISPTHAKMIDKILAEREAKQRFYNYICDICGKQETFPNPQEARLNGWEWGNGSEFCFSCNY